MFCGNNLKVILISLKEQLGNVENNTGAHCGVTLKWKTSISDWTNSLFHSFFFFYHLLNMTHL